MHNLQSAHVGFSRGYLKGNGRGLHILFQNNEIQVRTSRMIDKVQREPRKLLCLFIYELGQLWLAMPLINSFIP